MIIATGVDLVSVRRMAKSTSRERFRQRVFTPAELAYCDDSTRPAESLAARFAAKEAVMKCLGTGWSQGVSFRDIAVCRNDQGLVSLRLSGVAAERASALGIDHWHLSLSHEGDRAIAMVIAEGR